MKIRSDFVSNSSSSSFIIQPDKNNPVFDSNEFKNKFKKLFHDDNEKYDFKYSRDISIISKSDIEKAVSEKDEELCALISDCLEFWFNDIDSGLSYNDDNAFTFDWNLKAIDKWKDKVDLIIYFTENSIYDIKYDPDISIDDRIDSVINSILDFISNEYNVPSNKIIYTLHMG